MSGTELDIDREPRRNIRHEYESRGDNCKGPIETEVSLVAADRTLLKLFL